MKSALCALLVLTSAAGRAQTNPAPVWEIQGVVRSGKIPLPGVTVSAINTATGGRAVTSTGVDGSYSLLLHEAGHYMLDTEMAAFARVTHDLALDPSTRLVKMDVELELLSRAQQAARGASSHTAPMAGRGLPNLSALQGENGESGNGAADQVVPQGMPVPGIAPESATESVAISGTTSAGFPGMSSEEMHQRMQDTREQREFSPFGGGGRGPGGPGGGPVMTFGGGRGRFNFNRPHGNLFYTLGDSAFDAAPYSLTGTAGNKPSYSQNRFGGSLGGPLNIPKIFHGGDRTFFFISGTVSRADNPYDAFATVPTLLERQGDFSQTRILAGPSQGQPVQIFLTDPQTKTQYQTSVLPAIDPAAAALLKFIPLPNLPGDVQNFHYITSATSNANDINVRLVHSFGGPMFAGPRRAGGPRNNLNVGFHYHTSDTGLTNPFPTIGGSTRNRSIDIPAGYVRTFGKLTNIVRVDFNRSRTTTQNLYAFVEDVAAEAGITGVSQLPFDWGVPSLSFTNFSGANDINPLLRRDQTFSISDFMVLQHRRHTLRWGGDFRRIQLNTETDSNARGGFIFTGLNTAELVNGAPVPGTGYDFADFLLGLPQQTSVQFGANNYHFRGNSWDLFAQDEWRLRGNLTLNLGLRYEYVSPFTEINGLIANLDVAPGFTAVVPVCPANTAVVVGSVQCSQTGPYTGFFPASLLNPDRNNFAPRLGIAWKPFEKTVVRAGYGINYNTGQYANIVQQLAFQPPFSITQTNVESAALPLTLQNGFPAVTPSTITNNYGVDPNYRLGYVQIWNLDVQRELRTDLVVNIDYTGTKGTHLDILEAPNRTAAGVRIPGVQPFLWETSEGASVAHAGSVRIRKRLQHGVSVGGTYTFSKSIDNASTIGGGAAVVAQNAFDLAAERDLSSFDQTHRFTADYLLALPFGHDKRWLTQKGVLRDLLGDWQWSGNWTIASGVPFTARVLGDFADVNRGTNGTLRADVTGQPIALADPSISEWFNTAAFALPPLGQFGDAGRNTIRGPGSVLFNMAFTKLVPLGDVRMLELRAQASNIFNTPQFTIIDTVVNSPSFGRVTTVGAMRRLQLVARFRF